MTGWKIVPVETTGEMFGAGLTEAAKCAREKRALDFPHIYPAMLKAAPDYIITDEDVERTARAICFSRGNCAGGCMKYCEATPTALKYGAQLTQSRTALTAFIEGL